MRREGGPCDEITKRDESRTEKPTEGKQGSASVRTHSADGVGNDESHEGKQSRYADGGSRKQGGEQKKERSCGLHVHAETCGVFFSERHDVQQIGKREGNEERKHGDNRRGDQLPVGDGGEIPDLEIVAENACLGIERDDGGGECVQKAVERNAHEDQRALGGAEPFGGEGDQHDRDEGADKGKE